MYGDVTDAMTSSRLTQHVVHVLFSSGWDRSRVGGEGGVLEKPVLVAADQPHRLASIVDLHVPLEEGSRSF